MSGNGVLEDGHLEDRLRDLIAQRGYGPGDRLPPERVLIDDLGVSRVALRRTLDMLERKGTIWRHVGKGTFLSGDERAETNGPGHEMTPPRMMQARLCLEPALAREAAIHASPANMAELDRILDQAESVTSWRDYESRDDALHAQIARACDNSFLLSVFERLNAVRRSVAWREVSRSDARPRVDHPSHAQHRRIAAAIRDRDADGAWKAMRDHLKSVSDRLFS